MFDEFTDDVLITLRNELVKLIDRHGRVRKSNKSAAKGWKGNVCAPSPSCPLHNERIRTLRIATGCKLMPASGYDYMTLPIRVQIVFRYSSELAEAVSKKKLILKQFPRRLYIYEASELPLKIAKVLASFYGRPAIKVNSICGKAMPNAEEHIFERIMPKSLGDFLRVGSKNDE